MGLTSILNETRTSRRSVGIAVCAVALLLAGVTHPARADDEDVPEVRPFNYAFASYVGGGFYAQNGRTLWIVPIPVGFDLRSEDEHFLGIRLTLKLTLGFFDFKPQDLVDFEIPDRIGTVSLLPGVEFPMRVTKNWLLTPFGDIGAAADTEHEQITWVAGLGAHSRAEFHWKRQKFLLWNRLVYARDFANSQEPAEDFLLFETIFEPRVPLGAIRGNPTDVGLFLLADSFFYPVIVPRTDGGESEILRRYEIGITYGSAEPTKLWIFPVPRIGLSWRFGQDANGIRFILTYAY
jgi:hypothetical protein